jgi:hypothetical protein
MLKQDAKNDPVGAHHLRNLIGLPGRPHRVQAHRRAGPDFATSCQPRRVEATSDQSGHEPSGPNRAHDSLTVEGTQLGPGGLDRPYRANTEGRLGPLPKVQER